MAKFYEVLTASPLGDPWGEGNKNQTYWCQVDGINLPVMINAQSPIKPGDHKFGDIIMDGVEPFQGKKSQYYKFKGSLPPQGTVRPQSTGGSTSQGTSDVDARLLELEKRVDNLELLLATPTVETKEVKPTGVSGGNISKEELEDIFGGEMDIQDIPDKTE